MKFLLLLLILAITIGLVFLAAWRFAPRQPDETPTPGSDNPDQWEPYR